MILPGRVAPHEEQGGAILEVNAGPGLLMHLKAHQRHRRARWAWPSSITCSRAPKSGPGAGRIPLVGIAGTQGNAFIAPVWWAGCCSCRASSPAWPWQGMFLAGRQTQTPHRPLGRRPPPADQPPGPGGGHPDHSPFHFGRRPGLRPLCLVGVVTDMDGWKVWPATMCKAQDDAACTARRSTWCSMKGGRAQCRHHGGRAGAAQCDPGCCAPPRRHNAAVAAPRRRRKNGRAVFVLAPRVVLARCQRARARGQLRALPRPTSSPDTTACWRPLPRPGRWHCPGSDCRRHQTFEYQI